MNLRTEVSKRLVAQGYRREGRSHLLRLDQDFSFCVDTGPIGNRSDIAPFVFLRSDLVETAFGKFLGVPRDDFVASAGGNVGYVLGRGYLRWDASKRPEEVMVAITESFERLRPHASLSGLEEVFQLVNIIDDGVLCRRVVIAALAGDPAAVDKRLAEARLVLCSRDDAVCEQFRGFEARVKAFIRDSRAQSGTSGDKGHA